MRAGLTLIEVLVALVLFEFGMLALAGMSVVAARELGVANRRARARAAAAVRVESLRVLACGPDASGTARLQGGLAEYWRLSRTGMIGSVSDSIAFPTPRGGSGAVTRTGHVLCE